jgi:hypothetical protein
MSLDQTFCASPWFHMEINNAGVFRYCRWADPTLVDDEVFSIHNTSPDDFFQTVLTKVRKEFLAGNQMPGCQLCVGMEKHSKVSGRQKQLLKIGVTTDNFSKTMLSSPWINHLSDSITNLLPQDWQIHLGNFCNSSCVFCNPESSSRLATEFKKLKIVSRQSPSNWCEDPILLQKFIDVLVRSPSLKYLHFIGGETLITPAFKQILNALVEHGLNDQLTIGFTTNLNCWDDSTIELLTKFKSINLGMSIECFDPLNDYVRWPSSIDNVSAVLDKWISVARQNQWIMQLRTTPTFLTIGKLLPVYKFAMENGIAIESCNFLTDPAFFKISVLPHDYRKSIIADINNWLTQYAIQNTQIINTRNPVMADQQILQDLLSYVNYLETEPSCEHLLPECVTYLKLLESNRKNSILTYLPEYEELFRSAGY